MFCLPRFQDWVTGELLAYGSTWKIEVSPQEQLGQLVDDFVAGEVLTVGWQFKALNHHGAGIWELKTADLRIFGWFHFA